MPIEVDLYKFNPRILEKKRLNCHAPVIACVGKRGSGKSTIVEDLLYNLKDVPMVICMSGTEEGNGFYSKHIHPLCIYNEFRPDILKNVISSQKNKINKLQAEGQDPKDHPEIGVCVLMDDLQSDKRLMKDESFKWLFLNGRHYHITVIITCQYMMAMPPDLRTNVDYIFACKENKKDNIERLYKYFFSIFDKYADFKKVFAECTNDFGCIVIDNVSRSNRIEEQIFWYKAELNRQYKIAEHLWDDWDERLRIRDENLEKESEENGNLRPEKESDIRVRKKNQFRD